MQGYTLKENEVILFQHDVTSTKFGVTKEILLTNINFVVFEKTKKLFSKEEVQAEIYPVDTVKCYNGVPQIKAKNTSVEIFFTNSELTLTFLTKHDAVKLVNTAIELITGKTLSARGADKVKDALHLMDNTLGINTVETVKNVLEKGVTGSVLGVVGKKANSITSKNKLLGTALNFAKESLITSEDNQTNELPETNSMDDKIETLKKMKDLLDAGILTQEEFDSKKKELLGL